MKNSIIYKIIHRLYCKYKFRKYAIIERGAIVSTNSLFEGYNKISIGSYYSGEMGFASYIGRHSHVEGKVGRFTSIGDNVGFNRGKHPIIEPYVSTSPMFYSIRKQNGYTFAEEQQFDETGKDVYIGNDCWIGERVFLVSGIKIGDGAVVYAGAVVTKDVPPYAVVAGVPAKIIKYRYDKDTIKFLMELKWWNMDINWLKNNWQIMTDMQALKKMFKNDEGAKFLTR